ncbi:MAG: methionine adenosyltransferase [Acidobacteria bacterium]|jgi:S-adenosylmethionine synthetase|nr:methionine adenosyltransferase [Acidobacteriota bacterium]
MSNQESHVLTAESVTEGHPDKIADQISDSVLDAVMSVDPMGRVACETMVTTGLVVVAGEITTDAVLDVPSIVRETVTDIGYTRAKFGFDSETCAVMVTLDGQSPDIAQGVDPGGAGDQGLMYGYASVETPELMPLPIMLSHRLARQLSQIRKDGIVDYLRPDGKSQVTIGYEGHRPKSINTVVISTQHGPQVSEADLHRDIEEHVIKPVLADTDTPSASDIVYHINPTGRFVTGGPQGDCGLTGRKIIVDTYGGVGGHGGGAFSGKDCTKVDRTACYMARHVAKNLVAAGAAERLTLQVAYAIGVPEPVSVMINTHRTGRASEEVIIEVVRDSFDMTPKAMIEYLDLRRPIYRQTAAYGHFGREEPGFTWEELRNVNQLNSDLGLAASDMPAAISG